MPNFNKKEEELISMEDKWLYLLKNLHKLTQRPAKLQKKVFEKTFKLAEIAKFTPEDRSAYNNSLKYYRDLKNSLDTSFAEGKIEEKRDVIKNGYENGLPNPVLAKLTQLSEKEVAQILKELRY